MAGALARPGTLHHGTARVFFFFLRGGGGSLATFAIRGYAPETTTVFFIFLGNVAVFFFSNKDTVCIFLVFDLCCQEDQLVLFLPNKLPGSALD